ncbi:hypothetical protein QCA50_000857 [Cerrena zonata]|uniref:Uncharacterized protein n=1 Tax=Cerrena zonata TaxID=2478898 RepID=A0AAW0H0I6_9APHY
MPFLHMTLPKSLTSPSDPFASQHEYATSSSDQSDHLRLYSEGWERVTSRRHNSQQKCRINCDCHRYGPPCQNGMCPAFSENTDPKSALPRPPHHDQESKRARVLRWRNSISAECGAKGLDEVSESIMSDQDDNMEVDDSDDEVATHPDDSSEESSSQDTNEVSTADDFRIISITDLEAVTTELGREGLKWRVFYPPRRSCSNVRDAWLAVGPTNHAVECAARRIMSGAMKTALVRSRKS